MKSISFALGAIGAAALLAGGAFAQNAEYSAESIIQHFESSGDDGGDCAASGDCIAKSGTRGLSIGAQPAQPTPVVSAPAVSATAEPQMGEVAPSAAEPQMGEIAPAATSEPRMGEVVASTQPVAQPAAPVDAGFNLLITFELGSARLTPQAQANLDQFATAASDPRLASAIFAINGHTDASGDDAYNMALSEQRAASVVEYLTAKGIDSSRLIPRGFGEESPRTADPYDGANRRVEAAIVSQ